MDETEKFLSEMAARNEEVRNMLSYLTAGIVGLGLFGFAVFTIKDIVRAIKDKTR
ncbi:MAG: hypothetical protein LBT45_02365 [Rickettsiales bacterium]|jgi:hypothetical protein|nr:hypothetical protein [Rickettsiales bacterium]